MSRKKKRTVYSTDPEFVKRFFDEEAEETLSPENQRIRVWLDRIKGNKVVTRVQGFVGSESDLAELGQVLKKKCGTGGAVKEDEILLQGDHREKVLELLKQAGYSDVKKAGG